MGYMQHKRYSIKGTRSFEMTLASELRRQIAELRAENEALTERIAELTEMLQSGKRPWPTFGDPFPFDGKKEAS